MAQGEVLSLADLEILFPEQTLMKNTSLIGVGTFNMIEL